MTPSVSTSSIRVPGPPEAVRTWFVESGPHSAASALHSGDCEVEVAQSDDQGTLRSVRPGWPRGRGDDVLSWSDADGSLMHEIVAGPREGTTITETFEVIDAGVTLVTVTVSRRGSTGNWIQTRVEALLHQRWVRRYLDRRAGCCREAMKVRR